MATTTTNFGWDIPQSTDLVKDGATAIAALGQDIDTAMVDLKGGTTGQVLAKASGTDLDFSWVAQDDSNAIQNAIVDAKGDLIGATAADTPARLAVGTNGQILTADSTAATGLAWATPASSGGMTLLSTTTLSGASTTVSTIDQTYNSLLILVTGISFSATAGAYAACQINGTSNLASTVRQIGSGATVNSQGIAAGDFQMSYNNYVLNNTNNAFSITIDNYASTTNYKPYRLTGQYINNSSVTETTNGGGNVITNSAVSSLKFTADTSSFNGGTVRIYGVK
jgi:hypothetical protein